ncbi:MAG: hypothetical protein ACO1QB_01880 [Verrucomicrobiales bacterium]
MNLDEAQRKKVSEWIDQGLKLSEVQSRISTEFGISLTYMQMRFLMDDLALKPKDLPPPLPVPAASAAQGSTPAPNLPGTPFPAEGAEADADLPADELMDEDFPPTSGSVSVSVDQVTRPGAMVSGKVTFSDQQTAEWYLDQTGRLGIVSKQAGYKPSQQDIMEFQMELQNALGKLGY